MYGLFPFLGVRDSLHIYIWLKLHTSVAPGGLLFRQSVPLLFNLPWGDSARKEVREILSFGVTPWPRDY
jgi:hypothetical protein